MKNKVFISYAHKDKKYIKFLAERLRQKGILSNEEDTYDAAQSIIPGSSIKGLLRNFIEEASKVVILWTEESANSKYVNYEAGMAEALGKQIIVVVPKGRKVELPSNLAELQVVELDMSD